MGSPLPAAGRWRRTRARADREHPGPGRLHAGRGPLARIVL